jgi:hypothetical protein
LSAGEKLALGHAPGRCYCNEDHQKFGFQHWLPNQDNARSRGLTF